MKASINRTKAKKALMAPRAAVSQLNSIRPSEAMEPGEFVELCEVRNAVHGQVDKLNKLVKGGEA